MNKYNKYIIVGCCILICIIIGVLIYFLTRKSNSFVAVGSSGTDSIAYSTDGKIWKGITGTSVFDVGYSISYNGSRWIAGGKGKYSMAYSDNMIDWKGITGLDIFSICKGISCKENFWVAVGTGRYSIMYSEDNGYTWKGVDNSTTIFDAGYIGGVDVKYNGKIWVATGKPFSTINSSIAYSNNGIIWKGIQDSANYANPSILSFYDKNWIIGDNTLYSEDGITWNIDTTRVSDVLDYFVVHCNENLCVFTGKGNGNSIATSSVGEKTLHAVNKNIFDEEGGGSVTWNGGIWVCVGSGTNSSIAWSTDGNIWNDVKNNIFTTGNAVCAQTLV
jgi:hypothetical protein